MGCSDWHFQQETVDFRTEGICYFTKQLNSHVA
jgi:hypothetical protein